MLSGVIFDFFLVLPFAVGLALHNQVFNRPNFHFAAVYAAVPLLATLLTKSGSNSMAIMLAIVLGLAITYLLDKLVGYLDDKSNRMSEANSFFISAVIYLASIQVLLIVFGAAPRTLNVDKFNNLTIGGITLNPITWFIVGLALVSAFAVISWYDSSKGDQVKLCSGDYSDAVSLGLNVKHVRSLALVAVGLLIVLSSISRGVVVPFSVDSTFSIYILCFCASALPYGTKLSVTMVLLFGIYLLRGFFAFFISAKISDALTIIVVLTILVMFLARNSIRRAI